MLDRKFKTNLPVRSGSTADPVNYPSTRWFEDFSHKEVVVIDSLSGCSGITIAFADAPLGVDVPKPKLGQKGYLHRNRPTNKHKQRPTK